MNTIRMRLAGLAAGAALAASVAGTAMAQAPGVTDSEIKIGALGALTGATAFIGGPGRDGLQLAFDTINEAGGINGRTIDLVFEHAFTPAESVAAAKKLVESDEVFVLILASGSTGAAAAADYVRETGVPTYNIFGATPIIRTPFARNVLHSAIPAASTSAAALADIAFEKNPGAETLGILVGSYAFPQSNLAAIRPILEERGIEPVIEQFEQNARDYTSQLLSFARADVDSIIVMGSFSEAGFAIKQAPEVGLTDVVWVLDGSASNNAIVPIIGDENPDNIWGYSNVPAFVGQSGQAIEAFEAAWREKYGEPPQGRPNLYDIVGYGAAYILATAIDKAGEDLTRDSLIQAWTSLENALPSALGGFDVIYPESFSPENTQGNDAVGRARIIDGVWQVVPE